MSIAFTVNAGPLTQIGLELASLPTAYALATGAYGWFKARERSKSLQELLSVSGGQLVSTSSFNLRSYRDIRTDHTSMQGVVVQDRKVQRTSLPKGSTAIPEHPGTACLRALTTGLLVLHKTEAVVEILQDLIPYGLVQLNQEDTHLEIDRALLTSLKQWVSAVALEEDSDLFRKFMLETVAARQSRMTGAQIDDITGMDHTSVNELPLVIGALRWILTPPHSRVTKNYPTRSLKVWTMASIMEIIGFEIEADSVVVQNTSDYKSSLLVSNRFREMPRVFLVVVNGEETDPTPLLHIPRASDSSRPQITIIRGIPWIMFRHLRAIRTDVNTQFLADVWTFSFRSAKACFRGMIMRNQTCQIEIEDVEPAGVPEHHKSLISEFSPELHRICGTAMRQYIPNSPLSPGWDLSEIRLHMDTLIGEEQSAHTTSPCRDSCYILYAIVCGAIHGLCSNVWLDSGHPLSEDSEVGFAPDVIFQNGGKKLKEWATTVGHCIRQCQIPLDTWSDLMFEIFLGKDSESSAFNSMNAPSTTVYMNMQNPHRQRLVLGAQSYGLTAVSDMLVKLTTKKEAFCYYHISRGQMLSFPLTEDFCIEASTYLEPAWRMSLDPEPNNLTLYRFDSEYEELAMRVDVEPCWADDPRTVLFVLRSQGVPISTLNIYAFLDRMSWNTVGCTCQKPSWEISVPTSERWQLVSLYQLLRLRNKGMSSRRVNASIKDVKIFIDASQSVAATIYAICILHTSHLGVATECLACTYDHVMYRWRDTYATIVVTR
ncbi:MAG: hypothetical protein Q9225_001255 [Loekoesia sp. 1 TL-2023]